VITLYALALPVVLGMTALAFDGGKIFVSRLHMQNAADAAALATAQDLAACADTSGGPQPTAACLAQANTVQTEVNCFALANNAPIGYAPAGACSDGTTGGSPATQIQECAVDPSSPNPPPSSSPSKPWSLLSSDQRKEVVPGNTGYMNCYQWPLTSTMDPSGGTDGACVGVANGWTACYDRIEVRLRETSGISLPFGGLPGFPNTSHPWARSIGAFNQQLFVSSTPGTTVNGTTIPGMTHTLTYPGSTVFTTDPATVVTNTTTNSTFSGGNGGVAFIKGTDCNGAAAGTDWPGDPGGASIQWSGAPSTFSSYVTNGGVSITGANTHKSIETWVGKHNASGCEQYQGGWQVTGPPPGSTPCPPTPASSCPYIHGPFAPLDWPFPPPPAPPAGCLATGTNTITAGWKTTHPPGVYCFTTGALTLSANSTTFTGYSFYAPSMNVNSNSMTVTPSASFTCGTRVVLFDAYAGNLTLNGNGDTLNGDMYATNGEISITGGGSFAGCGYMETLKLLVGGNFAGYTGTGPGAGGGIVTTTSYSTTTNPGSTHPSTTIPPSTSFSTDPDIVSTGTTNPGTVVTATTGTNIGLGG
jgi:hypothetical protein